MTDRTQKTAIQAHLPITIKLERWACVHQPPRLNERKSLRFPQSATHPSFLTVVWIRWTSMWGVYIMSFNKVRNCFSGNDLTRWLLTRRQWIACTPRRLYVCDQVDWIPSFIASSEKRCLVLHQHTTIKRLLLTGLSNAWFYLKFNPTKTVSMTISR